MWFIPKINQFECKYHAALLSLEAQKTITIDSFFKFNYGVRVGLMGSQPRAEVVTHKAKSLIQNAELCACHQCFSQWCYKQESKRTWAPLEMGQRYQQSAAATEKSVSLVLVTIIKSAIRCGDKLIMGGPERLLQNRKISQIRADLNQLRVKGIKTKVHLLCFITLFTCYCCNQVRVVKCEGRHDCYDWSITVELFFYLFCLFWIISRNLGSFQNSGDKLKKLEVIHNFGLFFTL